MGMDVLKILKEKLAKKEALDLVYREPDGSLRYYRAIPFLLEQSYFQGLTTRGTMSFQMPNIVVFDGGSNPRPISWRHIKNQNRLVIFPGRRQPVPYKALKEEEKFGLMRAIFEGQVRLVGQYIILYPGETDMPDHLY